MQESPSVDQAAQSKSLRGPRMVFKITSATPALDVVITAFVGSLILNLLLSMPHGLEAVFSHAINRIYFGFGVAISTSLWIFGAYLNALILPRYIDWIKGPFRAFIISLSTNVIGVMVVLSLVYIVYFGIIAGWPWEAIVDEFSIGSYITSVIITLLITGFYQSAFFLETWKESALQAEKLKTAEMTARFESLSAQINPHFLFNSLNVLSALVRSNPDLAERFIDQLSSVYRYVLEVRSEPVVSLARELSMLNAYGKLLSIRFGEDRLKLDLRVEPKEDLFIVPLSLQMLLENAVKHNGATVKEPLHIEVFSEGDTLLVSNNRVKSYDLPTTSGIGLENIRERYRLLGYENVQILNEPDRFTVQLPLIK